MCWCVLSSLCLLFASVLASMRWLLCEKTSAITENIPRENLSPLQFYINSKNKNRIKLQSLQSKINSKTIESAPRTSVIIFGGMASPPFNSCVMNGHVHDPLPRLWKPSSPPPPLDVTVQLDALYFPFAIVVFRVVRLRVSGSTQLYSPPLEVMVQLRVLSFPFVWKMLTLKAKSNYHQTP